MDRHYPDIDPFSCFYLAVMFIQPGFQHLPGRQVMIFCLGLNGICQKTHCAGAIYALILIPVFLRHFPHFTIENLFVIPEHADHTAPVSDLFIQWIHGRNGKLKCSGIPGLQFQHRIDQRRLLITRIIQYPSIHFHFIHYKDLLRYSTVSSPFPSNTKVMSS